MTSLGSVASSATRPRAKLLRCVRRTDLERQVARMESAEEELDRYFEMIHRRVPTSVARPIRWLRRPSSFWARLFVASLFILGAFFSFLPVLGLWMLPLGLLLIAQDVPVIQKPLAKSLNWIEAKWSRLRERPRQPPS